MKYFNANGRRARDEGLRVFSETPKSYYSIRKSAINYAKILENSVKYGGVNSGVSLVDFEAACSRLRREIQSDAVLSNLLCGVRIPFICKKIDPVVDLGRDLEEVELPSFQRAFNDQFPDNHFKAVLQSNSQLSGNVKIDPRSRYQNFLEKCQQGTVVGWYFPQALQEFDIESQRKQMLSLPDLNNVCLSGGIDIMAALIGTPDLLINEEAYAPILCLSSYMHSDPRLVLLIKSYGPHMEFWCMTQMLTKNTTQVSEQWSGGFSIYRLLE
jgi:hypothetical protein